MKTNSLIVRMAALSALFALQACQHDYSTMREHDPWQMYKLGSVYDCDAVAQPDIRLNTENAATPSLGCAHQSNITVMVANPEDLQKPREMSPPDVAARQRVLDAYRAGQDTAVATGVKGTQSLVE